jgi:hypothetical protein
MEYVSGKKTEKYFTPPEISEVTGRVSQSSTKVDQPSLYVLNVGRVTFCLSSTKA